VCSFDTIGNRTRDLPVSGAVPQPSAPMRFLSPSNTIGNRTRDLPVSGAVPQPSAPMRFLSPSNTVGNRTRVLPASGPVPQPSASPRAVQWQFPLSAAVNTRILELRCRWEQKLSDINQIICRTLKEVFSTKSHEEPFCSSRIITCGRTDVVSQTGTF